MTNERINLTPWVQGPGLQLTASDAEITRQLLGDADSRFVAAERRRLGYPTHVPPGLGLSRWFVAAGEPLSASDMDIATDIGCGDTNGARRVGRARSALGHPKHKAPVKANWVPRLNSAMHDAVQAVPPDVRRQRIEAHLARRGTKAEAVAVAGRVLVGDYSLSTSMGRWSPEDRAEFARRAAWAGLKPGVYAAAVAIRGGS